MQVLKERECENLIKGLHLDKTNGEQEISTSLKYTISKNYVKTRFTDVESLIKSLLVSLKDSAELLDFDKKNIKYIKVEELVRKGRMTIINGIRVSRGELFENYCDTYLDKAHKVGELQSIDMMDNYRQRSTVVQAHETFSKENLNKEWLKERHLNALKTFATKTETTLSEVNARVQRSELTRKVIQKTYTEGVLRVYLAMVVEYLPGKYVTIQPFNNFEQLLTEDKYETNVGLFSLPRKERNHTQMDKENYEFLKILLHINGNKKLKGVKTKYFVSVHRDVIETDKSSVELRDGTPSCVYLDGESKVKTSSTYYQRVNNTYKYEVTQY